MESHHILEQTDAGRERYTGKHTIHRQNADGKKNSRTKRRKKKKAEWQNHRIGQKIKTSTWTKRQKGKNVDRKSSRMKKTSKRKNVDWK
jgi:hypothetical protein